MGYAHLNLEKDMHILMLEAIVTRCQQRIREGDCPTVPPFSVEQLEEAVVQLNREILLQRSAFLGAAEPDGYEQEAGILHPEAPKLKGHNVK